MACFIKYRSQSSLNPTLEDQRIKGKFQLIWVWSDSIYFGILNNVRAFKLKGSLIDLKLTDVLGYFFNTVGHCRLICVQKFFTLMEIIKSSKSTSKMTIVLPKKRPCTFLNLLATFSQTLIYIWWFCNVKPLKMIKPWGWEWRVWISTILKRRYF